jgi:hypothetical protein
MTPKKAVAEAVVTAVKRRENKRNLLVFTPKDKACVSPHLRASKSQDRDMAKASQRRKRVRVAKHSVQPPRPRSPKLQNMVETTWTSEAKYCNDMVPAPKRDEMATPAKISPWGVIPLRREKDMTRREVSMEPTKAQRAIRLKLTWEELLAGRTIMARQAPKAAPWDKPKVNDEARGLASTFCRTAPFKARIPPTARAERIRGSLRCLTR